MINISQIEKFSQPGGLSRLLFSGEAATPKACPEIGGKNYLRRGKMVEFPFMVSCGNKTGERDYLFGFARWFGSYNSQPKGMTAWRQRRNPQGQK